MPQFVGGKLDGASVHPALWMLDEIEWPDDVRFDHVTMIRYTLDEETHNYIYKGQHDVPREGEFGGGISD